MANMQMTTNRLALDDHGSPGLNPLCQPAVRDQFLSTLSSSFSNNNERCLLSTSEIRTIDSMLDRHYLGAVAWRTT
jgi:hypothetical protein